MRTSSSVVVIWLHSYDVFLLGKMPCWFFSRSELENTVSFRSGVNAAAEEKYRREGAKLIIDAGTALGLHPILLTTETCHLCKN